jgi:hypothetical protein
MTKNSFLTLKKIFLISGISFTIFSANAQSWENVGPSNSISAGSSSYNNLIIDASGNYYISYYDLSVSKASVQKFNGSSWSYLGGAAGITTGTATYSALSMDGTGSIYYSNQLGYPGTGMEVRKFSSGAWSQLTNATTASVNYQAIAVSSNNTLFSYSSDGSGTVRRYNNGTWEQVGNAGFSTGNTFAEMVIGSDNNIYVCHVASGVKVYKISTTATSSDTWTLVGGNTVGTAYSSDNSFSDIALDSNNVPYVAYVSSTADGRKLNVKKFDGTNWVQIGSANFSDTVVNYTALTVSSDGTPYVAASIWDSSNANHSKNQVYKYNIATTSWVKLGGDIISDGAATFNDIAIDPINNYVILTYSQGEIKVKKLSLANLSVTDSKKENVDIYPNPTSGIIHLKGNQRIKAVQTYSMTGQLISSPITENTIDISDKPKGTYLLKIQLDNGKELTKKVIKK